MNTNKHELKKLKRHKAKDFFDRIDRVKQDFLKTKKIIPPSFGGSYSGKREK